MNPETQVFSMMAVFCLVAMLFIATITDVITHRIPNMLLAPALGVALLTGAMASGASGVSSSIAGLAVGLAMLLPLYVTGGMGAGDVKLLGVAGAFLGPSGALLAGVTTFIAGAVFGLIWIAWRRLWPLCVSLVNHYLDRRHLSSQRLARFSEKDGNEKNAFAYAPAITTGATFALWQQGLLIPFVTS